MEKVKKWIIAHDDSTAFIITYITLAVVLSIAISLFWLVVVVFVHFLFEYIKQSEIKKGFKGVLIRSTWEILLDLALIFFALVIAIYMDIILGAAGIGAGARVGIQSASKAGTRFAGWQRAIRGILLSIDDAAQLTKFTTGTGSESDEKDVEVPKYGGWVQPWSKGDKFTVGFTILSIALIFLSPILTGYSSNEVISILLEDLAPIP